MFSSYVHGTSDRPLLGETIGTSFDRTVSKHAEREALVVTYQVCTDQVCLQPVEQGLPVTITRGSQ